MSPGTAPGRYRPTPPDFTPAFRPELGQVETFAIKRGAQFRVAPPPGLRSARYTHDYQEVKRVGERHSASRPPDRATVARFLAVNDYDYWRPVTAIHLADHEGNPRTDAHPGWASFVPAPPFPSYPSGHAITLTSPLVPDLVLRYTSWKQLTDDVDDARIYGGVHYHFDQEEAARQGRRVGTLRAAAPAAASPPARRRGHPVTGLLLVHGAWHGPWCWDALADRLIRHGHQVRAVQLRGHDQPPGRIWHRVHHNPRDGAAGPDPAPGHHRGHRPPDRPAPAGNGQGQPVAAAATLRRHPRAGPGAVLHPQTAQAPVEATFARLQEESWPAFIDTVPVRARPRRVRVPVLVLGAEHDRFFTAGEVRRTAAAYGTEAELLAGMATT